MLKDKQTPKTPLRDESGFTLLEIIAVIVILSIMAVVAVPKYFDLQDEARDKTIKTAIAEAIGRINGHFAKQVLGGDIPADIVYATGSADGQLGIDLGDFNWTVTRIDSNSTLTIQVTGKDDTVMKNISDTRNIPIPGL